MIPGMRIHFHNLCFFIKLCASK